MAFWKKILQKDVPPPKLTASLPTLPVAQPHGTEEPGAAPLHKAAISAEGHGSTTGHGEKGHAVEQAATSVAIRPVMTEKTSNAAARGQYVFAVSKGVNKPAIARAVARRFGVTVVGVRMLHRPGKERRRGRIIGWKPGFKKAMVTIKKGQKIDLQ